ncbi:unnamed protein product [Lathyrus sativus]|nr:unnamed protein product [Lathyrus sativus]
MASDETMMMTTQSSLQSEDYEEDDDMNDLFHHHHHLHHQNHHNLSRLSVCTSSGVEDDVENLASVCMSHLSIESFEADGDDEAEGKDDRLLEAGLSSGSGNESGSCYSLPATPPRRRNLVPATAVAVVKDYASENEVRKETKTKSGGDSGKSRRRRRRRRVESVFERGSSWENLWDEKKKMKENGGNSGESDQSNGNGVMVITRPKGGNRSLCMDLEEVKACRDLGFELEHERVSAVSFSNSTLDNNTSSGGNSPIANWRISGPGDDPRDVKARLKVWAQAVAIASASKYGS